jgi:hypothetical protein
MMIVQTLDQMVYDSERGQWFDPYQGGDDERMCFCDTMICQCAAPLNGVTVTVRRSKIADSLLADDPFAIELDSDDPFPF